MSLLLLFLPDRAHNTIEVEAELNGAGNGWTDLGTDVQRVPSITCDYGIGGAGPLDLVAGAGRLSFALNNGADNSGGLLGYYSPEHANCRAGFALGIGIRFRYTIGSTTYCKFAGTLDHIDPIFGQYGERKVLCSVVDWMDEAAIYRPNVATQVSKRADEILTTLVAAVPRQPYSTDFDTGDSTFAYALDNDQNEAEPVLTVIQKLAQSEYGRVYIKGDTAAGGVLTFERRQARLAPSPVASFTDTMMGFTAPHDRSLVINRVKATVHPRTVDGAATTVLFTLSQVNPSIHTVAAGTTAVIEGDYTDPTLRASRVGGTDMVTPVATTDYTMNAAADGSGLNLTGSFTVTAEYGANRVKYTITNGSGSLGYITLLQARGRGLYDYGPVDAIITDSSSITSYGERQLALDMAYESATTTAEEVGDYVLDVWASPGAIATTMSTIPATSAALTTAMAIEPGHALTITETATGVSSTYFVNHVAIRVESAHVIQFEWTLQRALITDFWTLGTAGLSELGETTVLA